MSSRIFVGNLPFDATDAELTTLFGSHGRVLSARIAVDQDTGRSRGYGFVEMSTQDEALAAIAAFQNHLLNGRRLSVSESRPRPNRRSA